MRLSQLVVRQCCWLIFTLLFVSLDAGARLENEVYWPS
jgi:hypothetical protein